MLDALPSLLVFIAMNFAAAFSGAFFRPGTWYRQLRKPSWQPPDWLFGPVWTVLYGMIAVAGWRVYETAGLDAGAVALAVYLVQLLLNAGWSALFFGLRRPDLALVEVVAFWGAILATVLVFYPIDALAAYLLLPYLAWVSFATVLNFTIWRLNPTRASADASGDFRQS